MFGVIRAKGRKGKYREEKKMQNLLLFQNPHVIREMTKLKYYAEVASKLVS